MSVIWFVAVFVAVGLLHIALPTPLGGMSTQERSFEAFGFRVFRAWFAVVLFLVAYLLIAGDLLAQFGFPYLFRSDGDSFSTTFGPLLSPSFWTSAALAILLVIAFSTSFVYETGDQQLLHHGDYLDRDVHLEYLLHHAVPLGACVLIAQLLFSGDMGTLIETLLTAGGLIAGFALGFFAVRFAYAIPHLPIFQTIVAALRPALHYRGSTDVAGETYGALLLLLAFQLAILSVVTVLDVLITGLAVLMLLGWIYLIFSMLKAFRPALRSMLTLAGILVIVVVNGVPDKHKYDAFTVLYTSPDTSPVSLVDPVASFANWKTGLSGKGYADSKPPLVVLALSGGAYRSSFWSAMVIDALLEESRAAEGGLRGVAEHVRLVSGSSGGMVAGAYFASGRADTKGQAPFVSPQLLQDILNARSSDPDYATMAPFGRDSLSPVAQHLVQRDVFKVFLPGYHAINQTDRGEVLERQWGSLKVTLPSLGSGELAGWRPSMLVTPVLAGPGLPLNISNLDLPDTFSGAVLSEANSAAFADLEVATAVRMQATFPYVTPAVRLPPPTHDALVDAGYYDNFGLSSIVSLFRSAVIRDWVLSETSGVIIVRVSAFDSTEMPELPDGYFGRAAQSLLLPPTTAFKVLESSAWERDTAAIAQLDASYAAASDGMAPDSWFTIVDFENRSDLEDASMSWYVSKKGFAEIESQLTAAHNSIALDALKADYQARLALP